MKWTLVLAIAPLLSGAFAGICCENDVAPNKGCAGGNGAFCVSQSSLSPRFYLFKI